MFKNILLAADGSDHSLRAAEKAAGIAKVIEHSKITLVHVVDETPIRSDVLGNGYPLQSLPEHRQEKLRPIEDLLKKHHLIYEMKAIFGEPGPSIVKAVNEGKWDLVVIGSRGLNPFQQMVLGSVSHKVAKRVKCPVMIVK